MVANRQPFNPLVFLVQIPVFVICAERPSFMAAAGTKIHRAPSLRLSHFPARLESRRGRRIRGRPGPLQTRRQRIRNRKPGSNGLQAMATQANTTFGALDEKLEKKRHPFLQNRSNSHAIEQRDCNGRLTPVRSGCAARPVCEGHTRGECQKDAPRKPDDSPFR